MADIIVEIRCPHHGFERFRVKIVRRFNIASNEIIAKTKHKPRKGEINRLYIGRNVSYNEARNYLVDHFRERGLLEKIVRMRVTA